MGDSLSDLDDLLAFDQSTRAPGPIYNPGQK